MRRPGRKLLLGAVLAGCAARQPHPPPVLASPASSEGLRVTLLWDTPVDLDLYVTNPRGETVYYGHPGGAFEGDVRCESPASSVRTESTRWRHPVAGRYRVGVDFPEACREEHEQVAYRLVIDLAGRRREVTRTARHLVRENAVVEVEVP